MPKAKSPLRIQQLLSETTAKGRLKRRSGQYITDLEHIRQTAKKNKDWRLASEITLKLLEHAIGKPTEHHRTEITQDIKRIEVRLIPVLPSVPPENETKLLTASSEEGSD